MTPTAIEEHLIRLAYDIGAPGWDDRTGHGIIRFRDEDTNEPIPDPEPTPEPDEPETSACGTSAQQLMMIETLGNSLLSAAKTGRRSMR